jgi:putative chitinase
MTTTAIRWEPTQRNIGAHVDGKPMRETWGRLLSIVAGRPRDATIDRIADGLTKFAVEYGLVTIERVAEFIAQCSNETGGFRRFEENLNYSALGLATTWPSRYAVNPAAKVKAPNAKALALARRPMAIANDTYAERMGNLPAIRDTDTEADGWQYRGRGMLQLTGRGNYGLFGQSTGLPLITRPELAADPFNSTQIALEFFRRKNVYTPIDAGDYRRARLLTNGGYIGVERVAELRALLLKVLA